MRWVPTDHSGYWVSADGQVRGPKGRILRPRLRKGYPSVHVARGQSVYVHTLVCQAFHGPRPTPAHQVAHENGDRQDNRSANLRWATPAENTADAVRHGTFPLRPGGSGERNGNARLTWELVRTIRSEAGAGATQASLAVRFGIGKSQVHNVVNGKQWRDEWRPQ